MGKLIKYEFLRSKAWFVITLLSVVIAQGMVEIGQTAAWEGLKISGLVIFFCLGFFGLMALLIFSVWMFSSDISKRHGYMIFLTPHSAASIIGSKLLIAFLSLIVGFAAYMLLFFRNISIATHEVDMFATVLSNIPRSAYPSLTMFLFNILIEWFVMIVTIYFSIALSHTLLEKIRLKWLLSTIIFLGINFLLARLTSALYVGEIRIISGAASVNLFSIVSGIGNKTLLSAVAVNLLVGVAFYFATSLLVEKKLSL